MPPGRKPGRGRGGAAGRGRGKAVTAAEDETPDVGHVAPQAPMQEQPVVQEPESTSAPLDEPEPMEIDPSPNSSPATIPTETPAPTPARTSAPRPILPPTKVSTASASASASKAGPGQTAAPAPSKFKPKAVRRAKDEREQLAREELARQKKVQDDARREAERASRGRGRGGRGRGDAMGRPREAPRSTAMGTFGITPEEMAKQVVPSMATRGGNLGGGPSTGGGGGGGGGSTGFGGRSGGGGGGGSGGNRNDLPNFREPAYPMDPDEVYSKPVDVANINDNSDGEDDVVITGSRTITKKPNAQKGLRPVRLPRLEHKERITIVNTDPNAVKKEETEDEPDLTVVEAFSKDGEVPALPSSPEQVKIKAEPVSPSSPRSRRTQPVVSQEAHTIDSASPPQSPTLTKTRIKPPSSPTTSRKPAPAPVKKPIPEPVFASEEDRAEHQRHQEDVAILARELGSLNSGDRNKGKARAVDEDGDATMIDAETAESENVTRDGRLYLFQFPPVLPKLYNPVTTKKPPGPNEIKIKKEDDSKGPTSPKLSKAKPKAGAKDAKEAIKTEPDAEEVLVPVAAEDPNARRRRDRVVDESGYIGKMIVRQSGKVEFDWGGASLVVSRGVDASFLSTGLIVDKEDRGGTNKEGVGKALSMGKIMGKFVVKPDFARMLGDDF